MIDTNHKQKFLLQKFEPNQIQELEQELKSQNIIKQHHAIIGIRKIIYSQWNTIDQLIRGGLIISINKLTTKIEYPQIQLQAIWIIRKIASQESQYIEILCQNGAIQRFIQLIFSQNNLVVQEALFALANLSLDMIENRDKIINLGLNSINSLLKNIQKSQSLLKSGVFLISNICRMRPNSPYQLVKQSLLVLIDILIHENFLESQEQFVQKVICVIPQRFTLELSDETLTQIMLALICYASQPDFYQMLIQDRVIKKFIFSLYKKNFNLLPSLIILNKVIINRPSILRKLISIDKHFLTKCKKLLYNSKSEIRLGILKIIQSVCAGTINDIMLLFQEQDLFRHIKKCLNHGSSRPKQKLKVLKIYTILIKKASCNELIINQVLSIQSSEIIRKFKIKQLKLQICELVYQILLFCYKCKENYNNLKLVFEQWKNRWEDSIQSQFNFQFDEKVVEAMLRIQRIILLGKEY